MYEPDTSCAAELRFLDESSTIPIPDPRWQLANNLKALIVEFPSEPDNLAVCFSR